MPVHQPCGVRPALWSSGPITAWQIDGGKVEAMTDFTFLGSQITLDGDCSHEIKKKNKQKTHCSLEGKLWQTRTAY